MSVDDIDYTKAKSWPYKEAQNVLNATAHTDKEEVIFETGYGPSGLPHIGTFGEVFRTTLVMNAYKNLAEQRAKQTGKPAKPAKLIVFSDDKDGFRKIPDNVPNKEMLEEHLGKPLTSVPDPYGTHNSFAEHNNARLQNFLDQFGFDYEFRSATAEYAKGNLDKSLLAVVDNYEVITELVKNEVGEERRQTYSPFMPICPISGKVLEDSVIGVDKEKKTVKFIDSEGKENEVPVTGGNVKLQWKVDWAARWNALDIDYEMAGFDLLQSHNLSGKIVKAMGGKRPQGMIYQLFVDENEQKISKSKGNGLAVEDWLKYGISESLQYYLFDAPMAGNKKLYFGMIQKSTDKYLEDLKKHETQTPQQRIDNPVHHIHNGKPPKAVAVSYSLMLNILSATGVNSPDTLEGMCDRYVKKDDINHELTHRMSETAIVNYNDLILPKKHFREPNDKEVIVLKELQEGLALTSENAVDEDYQNVFYEVGKKHYGKENLREFFSNIYQMTIGQDQGPRPGSLTKIIGVDKMIEMLGHGLPGNGAKGLALENKMNS